MSRICSCGAGMEKIRALLGSALFFALAPGTVAGFVPWMVTQWRFGPAFLGEWTRLVGMAVLLAGLALLIECFLRFALEGLGTPAPVAPTRHLVVSGSYRYVRNPMYVAVVSIVLGQALLFGSERLLLYGVIVWLCMHVFVVAYEEPVLRRTFGAEYENFRAHVPRWIPRLRAWTS